VVFWVQVGCLKGRKAAFEGPLLLLFLLAFRHLQFFLLLVLQP